jgi:uncharacterized membrane protein YgcG
MRHRALWVFVVVLLALSAPPLIAAEPYIADGAGIFSPTAIKTADGIIADLKRRFEMEVVVEVYPDIPADRKEQYNPEQRAAFFRQWALERANARKVHGIYVLICKKAGRVEVGADRAASRGVFKANDRALLVGIFVDKFKKRDFDAGLIDGLDFIRTAVSERLEPTLPPPTPLPQKK